VSVVGRLRDLLPPPLTVDAASVLMQLLDVIALEAEAAHEDLERVRQTHWIRTTSRLEEAEKIGVLVDIPRLPGEGLELYRERLLAMAVARLRGATGAREIRRFLYDYLVAAEKALGATFVAGLTGTPFERAYASSAERPLYRPLQLVENPVRRRVSPVLAARRHLAPYLFRWTETNQGLDDTCAELDIRGLFGGRTAVPVVVNLTSQELIGFRDVLRFGQRLRIRLAEGSDGVARVAAATIDGHDVTHKTFSVAGFRPGVPFGEGDLDPAARLPRLVRGPNEWIFLSVAHFDIKGLNRAFLAIADDRLYEGVFDETAFDDSLFPSGPLAWLSLEWDETEPAAFEAGVPRSVVVEPAGAAAEPPYELIERGVTDAMRRLHAAGVRGGVRFHPFVERQPQQERFELPFRVFDPERGPAGSDRGATIGGRFGETRLGDSRFE
jgi:hypothetical protein